MSFEEAARIADAVLYEGYALYPYRPSSVRNQARWQFGVLMPRDLADATCDAWRMQTECLLEPGEGSDPDLEIRFRCLQLRSREITIEQGGTWVRSSGVRVNERDVVEWDEGLEQAVDASGWSVSRLLTEDMVVPLSFASAHDVDSQTDEDGRAIRIVHETRPVRGLLRASAERAGDIVKLRITVENTTGAPAAHSRDEALRSAMIGSHLLLHLHGGHFISLTDPPEAAAELAARCRNAHTWPVLVGDPSRRDLLLSAPIILYDFPQIAPESPGDLFDGTEIDEILSLRVMTLTDEEKAEARATDGRVRDIIERTDALTSAAMTDLHGTIRDRQVMPEDPGEMAWRELLNPPGEAAPEESSIEIAGRIVARDSRVRLEPTRRADPIDLIVRGRTARVQGVYRDLDGRAFVAVVVDDDPSGDVHASYGRFLSSGPEDVVPL